MAGPVGLEGDILNKKQLKKRKKVIYDLICAKEYQPMKIKEICILLQIPKSQRAALEETLDALIADGLVMQNKRGKFCKVKAGETEGKKEDSRNGKSKDRASEKNSQLITGIFTSHSRGYGFVTPESEGFEGDIFIPVNNVGPAFHMDRVEVCLTDGEQSSHHGKHHKHHKHQEKKQDGKRQEGRIVRVLEHQLKEVVGTYEQSRHYGFVVPDLEKISKDIFIPQEWSMNAKDGDKVIVIISSYGSARKSPEGRIREVLGQKGEPGIDVMSVARSHGLPMEFSDKVLRQAQRTSQFVSEADQLGRKDLRSLPCVTIDGADAKDLDDAITIKKTEDGYELGVHIADVSNYVQAGSAMDREALRRGTSVYLVDRVIPMLPTELSNGICSLNQGQDRLALSCLMKMDDKGKILEHEIAETVIRVDRRMTYTSVQKILDGDLEECEIYKDFLKMFQTMAELSKLLRKRRHKRGAIDFDFPESKVLLDEEGHPVEIKAYEHNQATGLIEDFMLAANETVAAEFSERELPFLYRIHEEPDEEKMENVLAFARAHKIPVEKKKQHFSPKEVQKLLENVEGDPVEPSLCRMTLRSMKQARYSVSDAGHFGLAAKHYCHFTSPIRRYPDLQIHRIIKDLLRGRLNEEKIEQYKGFLDDVALKTSMAERRAEEAERETVKMKKAEYMLAHIGESFEGTISGLTGWGMYVELDNTVEGLVSMNAMWDDFYRLDEARMELVGEKKGKVYRLGQRVQVIVENADTDMKTVDFRLDRNV